MERIKLICEDRMRKYIGVDMVMNILALTELHHYHGLKNACVMTHKYRGSQQPSREVKPKFIDSTQGEPKNICKP
jgi:hypothetical protein